jgi:hypothetical protein
MKTDRCLVEPLENRQLLSASPVLFQGTCVNNIGGLMDKVVMSVTPSGSGFSDYIVVMDNGDKIANTTVTMDANGVFSKTTIGTDNLTLAGKMNAGETAVDGVWTMKGPRGGQSGAFHLALVPPANSTVPTTGTVTDYDGIDINSKGQGGHVALEVIDNDGVLTGAVEVHDYNNNLIPIGFNISSQGDVSFSFTLTDQTNIVRGKLSANGQIFQGSWISINTDGSNSFGVMTATPA